MKSDTDDTPDSAFSKPGFYQVDGLAGYRFEDATSAALARALFERKPGSYLLVGRVPCGKTRLIREIYGNEARYTAPTPRHFTWREIDAPTKSAALVLDGMFWDLWDGSKGSQLLEALLLQEVVQYRRLRASEMSSLTLPPVRIFAAENMPLDHRILKHLLVIRMAPPCVEVSEK